eukprot:gene9466-10453_t
MKQNDLDGKNTLSEYELLRQKRIAENEAMFKQLFPKGSLPSTPKRQLKAGKARPYSDRIIKKPRTSPQYPTRRNPSRGCKRKRLKYGSSSNEEGKESNDASSDFEIDDDAMDTFEDDDDEDNYSNKKDRLLVKFWGRKSPSGTPGKKRRSFPKQTVDRSELIQKYDMLTEEDLVLVAERTCDKRYDQTGTTCHQCRQKTDDLKTICRDSNCWGVRGQFCGPCLRNRYGEDAKEAILSSEWICPPCRGICNCSFCMPKRGRKATGILIHIAKGNGYDSVKSFLGD